MENIGLLFFRPPHGRSRFQGFQHPSAHAQIFEMMREIPNGDCIIFQLFRKRQSFSNQSGDSLSECKVEPFDMTDFFCFLSHSFMSFRWWYFFTGRPEIRVTYRARPVHPGLRPPKPHGPLSIPRSDVDTDDFSGTLEVPAGGIFTGNNFSIGSRVSGPIFFVSRVFDELSPAVPAHLFSFSAADWTFFYDVFRFAVRTFHKGPLTIVKFIGQFQELTFLEAAFIEKIATTR
jgi:hypothetical protein